MAKALEEKQRASQARAREIAERLARYQPKLMSEREWLQKAEVSPSFFSNLRGTPTKPPSVPSVETLEKVLSVARVSLAEFFAPDAAGEVGRLPSEQALGRAIEDALVRLPKKPTDRAAYLLQVVQGVLALPADRRASSPAGANEDQDDRATGALPRAASR